jgi:hypothetical protein
MTEDFIDKAFAGLEDYYPGSKRKRREKPKPEITPKADWDSRSYDKTLPNGKTVQMYTIGSLADALGRPVITLRLWMKEGHLPASPYRLPAIIDKSGNTREGRRLYTKAMIEAAVEIFGKAGLLEKSRVDWKLHRHLTREIDEAWTNIRALETTEKTDNTEIGD